MSEILDESLKTMQTVVCGEKDTDYSVKIPVTGYPVIITYKNLSHEDAEKNWNTPSALLFSGEEAGSEDSVKYSVTRSDSYGNKLEAEAFQYESQHLPIWKNWDMWLDANKKGTDCIAMAVRDEQNVLVRMENTGIVVTSITTLPEDMNDEVYLALTGEKCTLSDFNPMRDEEKVDHGTVVPVVVAKPMTNSEEGDMPNIDCEGWWSAFSDAIEVTETPVRVTYESTSYPQAKESWHAPLLVVYTSLDQTVGGVEGHEYAILRADGYGWKTEAEMIEIEKKKDSNEGFENWNKWIEESKRGVKAEFTAVRKGNTILINQHINGVYAKAVINIPIVNDLPIYIAISGELCMINNIRVNS